MKAIFIIALLGMLVVYPSYFYFLNEFKNSLIRDHAEMWRKLDEQRFVSGLQVAYRALRASRDGRIGGVNLSKAAINVRRKAIALLYIGMFLFLVVLGIGLFDSISAGKN